MPEDLPAFEALLELLHFSRGFDFTGYKRTGLMRRIHKRMHEVSISSFNDYRDHLELNPDEFTQLFNTILINVTSFFRDKAAWDYVAENVVPQILRSRPAGDVIRVWSAGSASGQEAYSIAMLFSEALGPDAFKERVKIYATDADEDALSRARQALFSAREMESVPSEWRTKYFEPAGDHSAFRKDLRRTVIFGRHDLMQDAPISRVDLLMCRNTLMYFNAETQNKILSRFNFALNGTGFLFLGKAEMLLTHSSMFSPVDLRYRVFAPIAASNDRDRLIAAAQAGREGSSQTLNHIRMRDAAFDLDPVAQIVVDETGMLHVANERARTLFGLGPRDIGRPIQNLEIAYRPVELRPAIQKSYGDRRVVEITDVQWSHSRSEGERHLKVQIVPLYSDSEVLLGAKVLFTDVSDTHQLCDDLHQAKQDLETAYEEMQATSEELETTNEELQSTIEELETTNEELQSTNEELETMNEELQSTNEELEAVNAQLQLTSQEVSEGNAVLESTLAGLQIGVAVVDNDMQVLAWNTRAEEFWGLRNSEVRGKSFLSLDVGLPVEDLKPYIQRCLVDGKWLSKVKLPAVDRRGRSVDCFVSCTPLVGPDDRHMGVIILMDNRDRAS